MQLDLFYLDENGLEQQVPVAANQFSIGRAEGNDLRINDAGISRRHALLTFFSGVAQVTDYGSANGTFLNGQPVQGNSQLKHGDVLTLGPTCKIRISLSNPVVAQPANSAVFPTPVVTTSLQTATNFSLPKISPMLMAGIATGLILLIAVISVAVVTLKKKPQPTQTVDLNSQVNVVLNQTPSNTVSPKTESSSSGAPVAQSSGNDPIAKAAIQVIRKISNDQSYPFTPAMLTEIKRRMDQLPSGSIANAMRTIESQGGDIAVSVRSLGLKPEMVAYIGLAETNGGQSGNVLAAMRNAIPAINFVRAHFGTNDADQTMLTIAAMKVPGGSKKSHPILGCLRDKANNPQSDRNVWFLHDKGCLNEGAFDFVLKVIACGIVAEMPRK
jgi:FHA domain